MSSSRLKLWGASAIVTIALGSISGVGAAPRKVIGSRLWIERAMNLVRAHKPTPPESARFYAYVASVYADARKVAGPVQASEATHRLIDAFYPEDGGATARAAAKIAAPVKLGAPTKNILDGYLNRFRTDRFKPDDPAQDMLVAPVGEGYWQRRTNKGPFAPSAGSWQRWIVPEGTAFVVAPPPQIGTPEYQQQVQIVLEAVARRDAIWQAKINFWAGAPGTEAPGGIWLNRLWTITSVESLGSNDAQYARTQKILAETIADAFMECWKIKYTYWTARPDMVIPNLSLGMEDPPFPGNVSGHSTVSAAAATILGKLVPAHASLWMTDAETARDTRLYAGIHFTVDNESGFDLGGQIGRLVNSISVS